MHTKDFVVVALSLEEPSGAVVKFLSSEIARDRLVFRKGSTLSGNDLRRISAEKALAVFFLNDHQSSISASTTALQILGVQSYTPNVEILAQARRRVDANTFANCDIDVILTFEDYKACISARNASCPGFSTLLEGLVCSQEVSNVASEKPWFREYASGRSKEVYYFPISTLLLEYFDYEWYLQ